MESIQAKWLMLGMLGQLMFASRFVVQWLASEKAGRSIVPVLFWYLSIGGSLILFIYALHRRDPVFCVGNIAGILIYSRNLWLIYKPRP